MGSKKTLQNVIWKSNVTPVWRRFSFLATSFGFEKKKRQNATKRKKNSRPNSQWTFSEDLLRIVFFTSWEVKTKLESRYLLLSSIWPSGQPFFLYWRKKNFFSLETTKMCFTLNNGHSKTETSGKFTYTTEPKKLNEKSHHFTRFWETNGVILSLWMFLSNKNFKMIE